jgi:carbon monoxide dehydrogenase subunit G
MVSGQDKRLRSQIRQRVTVSLSSTQDGRCQIGLAADLQLDGMLASLGERLLGAQIDQEVDAFVRCIQGKLLEGAPPGARR